MTITVEFYGLARSRVGAAVATVDTPTGSSDLGRVLRELAARYPGLAACCQGNGQLRAEYTANIGGRQFVRDPATPLRAGDALLILSADAGG